MKITQDAMLETHGECVLRQWEAGEGLFKDVTSKLGPK